MSNLQRIKENGLEMFIDLETGETFVSQSSILRNNKVTIFNFQDSNIRFELRDGIVWINLTDMAKASDKKVNDWSRLISTSEFLQTYSKSTGIPADQLINTNESEGSNKKVNDWNRLQSTQEFLIKVESVAGIPVTETIQGGTPDQQGTWAIEEVVLDFAAWCNVDFKLWVYSQIKTLLKEGTVSLPDSNKVVKQVIILLK